MTGDFPSWLVPQLFETPLRPIIYSEVNVSNTSLPYVRKHFKRKKH